MEINLTRIFSRVAFERGKHGFNECCINIFQHVFTIVSLCRILDKRKNSIEGLLHNMTRKKLYNINYVREGNPKKRSYLGVKWRTIKIAIDIFDQIYTLPNDFAIVLKCRNLHYSYNIKLFYCTSLMKEP